MKTLLATSALILLGTLAAPTFADQPTSAIAGLSQMQSDLEPVDDAFDRRGRGGRSKLRVPGGSGCDDPGDILEHPECAG
ncbi:hypothetical protein ACSSVY_000229 [Roseovarius sp. MBR-51]